MSKIIKSGDVTFEFSAMPGVALGNPDVTLQQSGTMACPMEADGIPVDPKRNMRRLLRVIPGGKTPGPA